MVDLVKRMSVNDLSNQSNAEICEQTIASGGYGNIGAERIKSMELQYVLLKWMLTMRPKKWRYTYPEQGGQDEPNRLVY